MRDIGYGIVSKNWKFFQRFSIVDKMLNVTGRRNEIHGRELRNSFRWIRKLNYGVIYLSGDLCAAQRTRIKNNESISRSVYL